MLRIDKNKVPFISVIITTYNRLELLKRAVNSLLVQIETDWEAIIVDDGSTDDTFIYSRELCQENPKFRYLYQSNRGVTGAKNAGILAASGVFVTFLDSDDEYHAEHLDLRRKILLQYPELDFLYGGAKIIGDQYVPDADNPDKLINLEECVIGGTFFILREKALELGGFPFVEYSEDSALYKNAIENELTIAKIDINTYIYHRDTPDSICNSKKSN
jgi:glycosyltransferase involved in cell wall biosynthesis